MSQEGIYHPVHTLGIPHPGIYHPVHTPGYTLFPTEPGYILHAQQPRDPPTALRRGLSEWEVSVTVCYRHVENGTLSHSLLLFSSPRGNRPVSLSFFSFFSEMWKSDRTAFLLFSQKCGKVTELLFSSFLRNVEKCEK